MILKSTLQFFMKCNQNCQSKAGNTRNRRRFKIMLTEGEGDNYFARVLCTSQELFVHNNSKFGANKTEANTNEIKRGRKTKQDTEPRIRALIPPTGTHNQLVVINGINFTEGLQAFIGQTLLDTRVVTDTAISVIIPPLGQSGLFRISLGGNGKSCSFQNPFRYINSTSQSTTTTYETMTSTSFRGFTMPTNSPILPYNNSQDIISNYEVNGTYPNNFSNPSSQLYFTNTPPQSPTGMPYNISNNYNTSRNGLLMEPGIYDNRNSYSDCMLPGKKRRTE